MEIHVAGNYYITLGCCEATCSFHNLKIWGFENLRMRGSFSNLRILTSSNRVIFVLRPGNGTVSAPCLLCRVRHDGRKGHTLPER